MHFFGIPNVKNLSGQEIIRNPIGFTVQKKCGVFCGMFLSFQFTKCGEILRWQRLECYPEKNGVHCHILSMCSIKSRCWWINQDEQWDESKKNGFCPFGASLPFVRDTVQSADQKMCWSWHTHISKFKWTPCRAESQLHAFLNIGR